MSVRSATQGLSREEVAERVARGAGETTSWVRAGDQIVVDGVVSESEGLESFARLLCLNRGERRRRA